MLRCTTISSLTEPDHSTLDKTLTILRPINCMKYKDFFFYLYPNPTHQGRFTNTFATINMILTRLRHFTHFQTWSLVILNQQSLNTKARCIDLNTYITYNFDHIFINRWSPCTPWCSIVAHKFLIWVHNWHLSCNLLRHIR